jgi:membrane-bound lytic murein transglycosylase D
MRTFPQLVSISLLGALLMLPGLSAQTPKSTPAQELIARVEAEYQRGESDYKAGHLEAAKQEFNRAVMLLLTASLPLHSDEALEHEFDKIVEQINHLEMQALQSGEGFNENVDQPAPIDLANEVTFPVDPRIKEQAVAELKNTHSDLPLILNDPVASFINFYATRSHGTITRALTRAGRYRPMIERIFKEEGVPQDLIYLAQAESGFEPRAVSYAGARGMWQFMASAADLWGLQHNYYVDERQDPEKSTRAAARYLKALYTQLGDWWLAMAAYNTGAGNVQHAVERTGYADFWELHQRGVLPQQTRNYVPIILAMTVMAKNPSQYNLDQVTPDPPLQYDTVTTDYAVDLRLVAESVDASTAEIQSLNPALLRMTTPREQNYDLHLPTGTTERYRQAIEAIPVEMRASSHFYKAQPGESLSDIAKRFHTTPEAIAEANNLDAEAALPHDAKLIVPVRPERVAVASSEKNPGSVGSKTVHYKVRKGDTAASIASDFGVTVDQLLKWNHLRRGKLKVGGGLVIHQAASESQASSHRASSDEEAQTCHMVRKSRHGKAVKVCSAAPSSSHSAKAKGKSKSAGKNTDKGAGKSAGKSSEKDEDAAPHAAKKSGKKGSHAAAAAEKPAEKKSAGKKPAKEAPAAAPKAKKKATRHHSAKE